MARRYQKEMGGLKEAFGGHISPGGRALPAFRKDPGLFAKETKGVFEALGRRIDKENDGLYTVVDRVG